MDLRIYRAFFAHTRYEMRKDDNRERGSNEHKEATRKKYNNRENEGAMSIEKRFVSGRYETRSTIIEATPKEF